jgi:hypothetical protein
MVRHYSRLHNPLPVIVSSLPVKLFVGMVVLPHQNRFVQAVACLEDPHLEETDRHLSVRVPRLVILLHRWIRMTARDSLE